MDLRPTTRGWALAVAGVLATAVAVLLGSQDLARADTPAGRLDTWLLAQDPGTLASVTLINNAGLQYVAPLEEYPPERWQQLIAVMLTGAALAWARALGEFGATLLFAGSLPGRTQTVPLAIYAALESDIAAARAISVVLCGIAFALLILLRALAARGAR